MASKMYGRIGAIVVGAVAATAATANADTIILNYVVTNTTNATTTFTITNNALTTIGSPTFITGSITGTVTDLNGNGATVGLAVDQFNNPIPIYTGLIDGSSAKDLMTTNAASFTAGQFFSNNATPEFFVSLPAGPVTQSIGITLTFTLTAGDSASFTSIFTVEPIPAPAGLALLGGVFAFGRRRRN